MSLEIKMNLTDSMADRIVISTEPTDINGNYTMSVPSFVSTYFQIQLRAHNEKKEKVKCRECDWLFILKGNEELRDVQDAYVAHLEEKHRSPKKEEPGTPLEGLIKACREAGKEGLAKAWEELLPKKEEPHMHGPFDSRDLSSKCPNCQKTVGQLERESFSAPKESDPELALSIPQMKELFDNLVMEGFTEAQAARIVGIVARG